MEACVGFLATIPGRLAPPLAAPEDMSDTRPGSGMMDDLREPPLPDSETEGEPVSGGLVAASAESMTSFKNVLLVP